MATPLRKNEAGFEQADLDQEEITTGDLARAKRPVSDTRGPQAITEVDRAEGGRSTPGAVEPEPAPSEQGIVQSAGTTDATPLFPATELDGLRTRWKEIQTAFVDEPRTAVQQADNLVASAMKRLAEVFADERSKLEQHWDRGDQVSTEDLRVALQRYRTFFERLLSV